MSKRTIILITGTSSGIGNYLSKYYSKKDCVVIGCSRSKFEGKIKNYQHFTLDVADEEAVLKMFVEIQKKYHRLDVLINNAGIASMNHCLLTPLGTIRKIMNTNFIGTFLFCREAAKIMQKRNFGRIVNFSTVAVKLNLEGEAAYAASKAAVVKLTEILAKELAPWNITVNAIGPTPVKTDLIKSVPQAKIENILRSQAIHRLGSFKDVSGVLDFFIDKNSSFITGQTIYLGGV